MRRRGGAPIIHGAFPRNHGSWLQAPLLVDTGADCTALSADVFQGLNISGTTAQSQLGGIGGAAESVAFETHLQLLGEDGRTLLFRGAFAAFTSSEAADMSVLGRDIHGLFSVIVDQPGDVVCLIGQRRRYAIEST